MSTIIDKEKFAEAFEEQYLKRGFGTMNKNDFEVLFFHLLTSYGDSGGKSNFELAKDLHISESKVKRLAYEAELLSGAQDDKAQQEKFLTLLSNAKIQKENGTLRFVVENKYLRSTIFETLKKGGYYLDSSFNSEIVAIHNEALIYLLDIYYSEDDKKEVVDGYRAARRDVGKADSDISFKDVMSTVFKKLLEKGVDEAADEGINFKSLIKTLSTGVKAIAKLVGGVAALVA